MGKILDGNLVSKEIKKQIAKEVEELALTFNRKPHLVAILVGQNGASKTYVNNKIRDCKEVGFKSSLIKLQDSVTEEELISEINKLNQQKDVDGFIVQLPLPNHINQEKIIMMIDPKKDVDGFHPENFGKMALDMPTFLPATPYGIISLLDYYNISTQGKHCVVVGRSRIVGKPMSILMARKENTGNATVTLTHSYTTNIQKYTQQADIVVTALGQPEFLKASMIKEGAVIIDVGITRIEDSSYEKGFYLIGDVDYKDVEPKASFITPVPGGVGPMTRAMLLKNTLLAFKNNFN